MDLPVGHTMPLYQYPKGRVEPAQGSAGESGSELYAHARSPSWERYTAGGRWSKLNSSGHPGVIPPVKV